MKLEKQVVSMEIAKRLKELGVKQESEYFWVEHKQINEPDYQNCLILHNKRTWEHYLGRY